MRGVLREGSWLVGWCGSDAGLEGVCSVCSVEGIVRVVR